MQLTKEGLKELDNNIAILEDVEKKYRQQLTDKQKKIPSFFKREDYFDFLFEIYTEYISGAITKGKLIERFMSILKDYYKKNDPPSGSRG
jgi:hypothetical protein